MNSRVLTGKTTSRPMTRGAVLAAMPWERLGLTGILLLTAFLEFFRLDREGYANLYYAAGVKSMVESWHNFFFVSFDPGGFVTVDKPPLGFWLQAASAKLFGFHGWSILLPQALSAVLAVALLYHLVRRTFGPVAGLIAALTLALTPISVVTARNNTIDSTLTVAVLLAAWAVTIAAETGKLRWLLLGAALVGVGFNIKMLEAYLILPALYLLYLLAAPARRRTRIAHLALASLVLVAVSLVWVAAVDLTPASQRPFVGSSTDNTELELVIGHNGLDRVLGNRSLFGNRRPATPANQTINSNQSRQAPSNGNASGSQQAVQRNSSGNFASFGNNPGPTRFLSQQLAGQISWLLPLALLGLFAAGWQYGVRRPITNQQRGVLFFGAWLVTELVFFSFTRQFQPYYLVVLAPGVAGLVGIGAVALWRAYRNARWRRWLLPVALLATAALEVYILRDFSDWSHRLMPVILALTVVAALALVLLRLRPRLPSAAPAGVLALGMAALLVAPAVWAWLPVQNGSGSRPYAGPPMRGNGFAYVNFNAAATTNATATSGANGRSGQFATRTGQQGASSNAGQRAGDVPEQQADQKLLTFLDANRGNARFLVAVPNANAASPIILATGQPVMALGGFSGSDPILTNDQLAADVTNGTVRYFLVPQSGGRGGGFGFGGQDQMGNSAWVSQHCSAVPADQWQSTTSGRSGTGGFGGFGGEQLYDCAAPKAQ